MTAAYDIVAEQRDVKQRLDATHQTVVEEDALEVRHLRVVDATQELIHVQRLFSRLRHDPLVVDYGTVRLHLVRFRLALVLLIVHVLVEPTPVSVKQERIVACRSLLYRDIDYVAQRLLFVKS